MSDALLLSNARNSAQTAHLTPPSPFGWVIWRQFVIRGAGFPAAVLDRLRDPELSALAIALHDAKETAERQWIDSERRIGDLIEKTLRQHGVEAPGQKPVRELPSWMKELRLAASMLKQRRSAPILDQVLNADERRRLDDSLAEVESLRRRFEEQYAQAQSNASRVIGEVSGESRFREAVAWQNHAAVTAALDPLAQGAAMPGAKRRQREDLVTSYLQRYAVKNDSIGFFGPMVWGRIVPGRGDSRLRPGESPLSRRTVYFEDWAVVALGDKVAEDPRATGALTPRLLPFLRLDKDRLIFPGGHRVSLTPMEAALLRACNGRSTAQQLATRLLANPFSEFDDKTQVFELLRHLASQGRIELGFLLPTCDARPELALRHRLSAIGDAELRTSALDQLSALEAARDRVAASAGSDVDVGTSLSALAARFEQMLGTSARRHLGEAYGGRGLVYEDCVRNVEVVLGDDILTRIQPSLDLILQSGRWFVGEVVHWYETALSQRLSALTNGADGPAELDFPTFWLGVADLFFDAASERLVPLVDDLTRRWDDVLSVRPGQPVERSVADIRDAVLRIFATAPALNGQSRYLCPDVLLCGEDPAADDLSMRAVLGEMHVGGNTLLTNGFICQHPSPQTILDARLSDLRAGAVPKVSAEGFHGARRPIRTQWVDDPRRGPEIIFSKGAYPSAAEAALPIGELTVRRRDGRLQVNHAGQDWQCDLMDLLADFIFLSAASEFRLSTRRSHSSRITVGGVVWQRESWRCPLDVLRALCAEQDSRSYLQLCGWAKGQGMPSRLFVKLPWENKPFLVDLHSLASVRLLVKQLRGADRKGLAGGTSVAFSEMLPTPEQLWLTDADGRRFTSEIRLVALHRDDSSPPGARTP